MSGNRVSHANNRTPRTFKPNLHVKRFWIDSEKRCVKLRISAKGIKIVNKLGIERVLQRMKARGGSVSRQAWQC